MRPLSILIVMASMVVGCRNPADGSSTVKATPTVHPGTFDRSYRAGKSIEGAIAVGVDYQRFNVLLQDFATELLILDDAVATPDERAIAVSFRAALGAYQDSATLWKQTPSDLYANQIIVGRPCCAPNPEIAQLQAIVKRYSIPVAEMSMGGRGAPPRLVNLDTVPKPNANVLIANAYVISPDAIQAVWQVAHAKFADGSRPLLPSREGR